MPRRADRSATALRPLELSQAVLSRVDGSAKFGFGNTSVLSSVTGPTEVRIRDEIVDRATLEVNVRALRGLQGLAARDSEQLLVEILSPIIQLNTYPRSLIQLTVQTVSVPITTFSKPLHSAPSDYSANGGLSTRSSNAAQREHGRTVTEEAARINSAMMALVDAGIACRGIVVAVPAVFVANADEKQLLLDPTPEEEDESSSMHLYVYSFGAGVGGTKGKVVGIKSSGLWSIAAETEAEPIVRSAAQAVHAFIRKSVEARYGVAGSPPPAQIKPAANAGAETEDESMEDA